MSIGKDKVIGISYELRSKSKDGAVVETVEAANPLQFIYGTGYMLPAFESKLTGLEAGGTFDFSLTPDEAYGQIDENAVVDLAKSLFAVDGEERNDLLVLGNVIPMRDKNGNRLDGTVLEIGDETVKLDFNHPLAGESLFFTGSVVEVRDASEEELSHGHIHHEHHDCNGCSHCG